MVYFYDFERKLWFFFVLIYFIERVLDIFVNDRGRRGYVLGFEDFVFW